MHLRHDAGHAAAQLAVFVRRLAQEMGGTQKGTLGRLELAPNLVNVVAERAITTVDLRNADAAALHEAERRLALFLDGLAGQERVAVSTRPLARFDPVAFPEEIVALVEASARELGLPCRRLASGAGHDAQMMARLCPAGMIFVPSEGGLSHNVREHTRPEHLAAGADVLLRAVARLAQ
jgi:N-carbamoyl-L-amino-acid hydrolase